MDKEFTNKDEYVEHLKDAEGEVFTKIAVHAAMMKATAAVLKGAMDQDHPMRIVTAQAAYQNVVHHTLALLITASDMQDRAGDILAAADRILDLANAEAHAIVAVARASNQPGERPTAH